MILLRTRYATFVLLLLVADLCQPTSQQWNDSDEDDLADIDRSGASSPYMSASEGYASAQDDFDSDNDTE